MLMRLMRGGKVNLTALSSQLGRVLKFPFFFYEDEEARTVRGWLVDRTRVGCVKVYVEGVLY